LVLTHAFSIIYDVDSIYMILGFMEYEDTKFSVLTEIFSQFTEENRDNLLKTAEQLLKVQQEDAERLVDTSLSTERTKDGLE